MKAKSTRRTFIKSATLAGIGLSVGTTRLFGGVVAPTGRRVGMIGLDTSHCVAFTKALNAAEPDPNLKGYKVVAAYPYGSKTIESSSKRIPGYTKDVQGFGVAIVDSIEELLEKVDVVLLETNDGRLHLEQALKVFKAGKRMFIDKPIAASLDDTKAIFDASKKYGVPVFSSSSLRYMENIPELKAGNLIGKITGADTYSPAIIEPTHPDLFWYGIHGVEILYAVLGTGCESVHRIYTDHTDVVVGIWSDGRVGKFRGIRKGRNGYGGTAFGEKGQRVIGEYKGYTPLLYQIVDFFESGLMPVSPEETLEIFAFMHAAEESKHKGGRAVSVQNLL